MLRALEMQNIISLINRDFHVIFKLFVVLIIVRILTLFSMQNTNTLFSEYIFMAKGSLYFLKCVAFSRHKGFSVFSQAMRRVLISLAILSSFSGFVHAEWTDKILEADVVTKIEDNINLAFFNSEEKKEVSVVPSLSLGRYYQLGNFLRFRGTVDLEGKVHNKYHGLNSGYVGGTLSLTYKTGLGLYKPWIKIHSSGGYLQVNDTIRDSGLGEAGLTIGKRITERIDLEAAYLYDFREGRGKRTAVPGKSGSVFDQDGHKFSILTNFLVTNKLLVSLGYSIRRGDIASTCNGSIVPEIVGKIRAITSDTSYNKPLCAYRIRSTIQEFSIGMTYALSGHSSLNCNYRYADGRASGLGYYVNTVNFGYSFSFW